MNLNVLDSSHPTEEDIGLSIVHNMMTLISRLNALRTDGFIATLDAKESTSTPSLAVLYVGQSQTKKSHLLKAMETFQSYGWDWSQLPKTLKEYLQHFLESWVGKNIQEITNALQAFLSPTSTSTETESSATKSDTTYQTEDSLFHQTVRYVVTDSRSYGHLTNTYAQQREAEIASSYDSLTYQPSLFHQQALRSNSEDCATTARRTDEF